jgi:hypothetical protein
MTTSRLRTVLLVTAMLAVQPLVWAWGHPGHQVIGSLADEMIAGSPAAARVSAILGRGVKDLRTAAPWPDCVRDVERRSTGKFQYNAHSEYHSPVCVPFEGPVERAAMEDFASRNWSNCKGWTPSQPACHRQYHFADVAVQHNGYATTYHGTGEADIVHAIQAAIGVLKDGPPAKAPFNIKTKKEGLQLLAHLMGDLHQPLHVGAIYLNDADVPVDPDAPGSHFSLKMETRGGNFLEIGTSNLHAAWDELPATLTLTGLATGPGKKRRQALIAEAKAVPPSPGAVENWPAVWASDTVMASHDAFPGLRFSRKGVLKDGDWAVQFNDQAGYDTARQQLQHQQMVKAAARLSMVLRAIWP